MGRLNEYGQLLKETRIRRDLKISDVAEAAGCSAGYLCDIENGKRFGKVELHRKIWSAFYLEASEVEPLFKKAKADHVIEVARKQAAELKSDAAPEEFATLFNLLLERDQQFVIATMKWLAAN